MPHSTNQAHNFKRQSSSDALQRRRAITKRRIEIAEPGGFEMNNQLRRPVIPGVVLRFGDKIRARFGEARFGDRQSLPAFDQPECQNPSAIEKTAASPRYRKNGCLSPLSVLMDGSVVEPKIKRRD